MGVSNPSIGYTGFAPSNDTLALVTTERGTNQANWDILYRGRWLSDVTENSIIRLKIDMRVTAAALGEMMWKIADNYVWLDATTNVVYQSKTDDVAVNWKREALIEIYGRVVAPAVLKLKNVEIAGFPSPASLWVA